MLGAASAQTQITARDGGRPGDGDAARDSEMLRRYLADRDAPCPRCGYNLRGSAGAACPECGEAIVLSVGAARQRWVPPLLGVLAFGWVLTAAVLNTCRNARWVYSEAWDAASGGRVQFGSSFLISPRLNGQYRVGPIAPAGAGGPGFFDLAWGSVPWSLWWPLLWSTFLAVGGAAGLVLLIKHRRRPMGPVAWAWTRGLAVTVFTVYGGFHLYKFFDEVMSWW